MDPLLTPYREIPDAIRQVGGTREQVKKLPKRYPPMKRGEVSFLGAGILPVCSPAASSGEFLLLSQRYLRGRKDPDRWYDFGGKKEEGEFPTRCACRHFAKKTYGVFGVVAPHLGLPDSTVDDISELLQGPKGQAPASLPLMIRSCEEWAKSQVGDMVFFHAEQQYFVYVVQVPYIKASILDAASMRIDGEKRRFQWLTCPDFCQEPLARRLHVDALITQISGSFGKYFRGGIEDGNRSTFTIKYVEDEENIAPQEDEENGALKDS